MEKSMVIYIIVFFKQIHSFRSLIYYGKLLYYEKKTMVLYRKLWSFNLLWKTYGTMERKTIEL